MEVVVVVVLVLVLGVCSVESTKTLQGYRQDRQDRQAGPDSGGRQQAVLTPNQHNNWFSQSQSAPAV